MNLQFHLMYLGEHIKQSNSDNLDIINLYNTVLIYFKRKNLI